MSQLSIWGFEEELERRIRELARKRGISLNKAAILLLRKGAGLEKSPPRADQVGDSLDSFIGSWTRDEETEFLNQVDVFERIHETLWS